MDTTLVYDSGDQVRIAYFEYGDGERDHLYRLPWGTWIGWVGGDSSLQIECRDGSKPVGTYVTGMFGAEATVKAECEVDYDL